MSQRSKQDDVEGLVDSATGIWATAKTSPTTDTTTPATTYSLSTETVNVEAEKTLQQELIESEVKTNNNNNNLVDDIILKLRNEMTVVESCDDTSTDLSTEMPKSRQITSGGSSTSSRESGTSSFFVNLAVPSLAGFIDSW